MCSIIPLHSAIRFRGNSAWFVSARGQNQSFFHSIGAFHGLDGFLVWSRASDIQRGSHDWVLIFRLGIAIVQAGEHIAPILPARLLIGRFGSLVQPLCGQAQSHESF
jgi:hypothetical protein